MTANLVVCLQITDRNTTPSFNVWPIAHSVNGIPDWDRPTYLSCSPVTSTSASRSSSAAFFCMVCPMPSISLLKTTGTYPGFFVAKQPHTQRHHSWKMHHCVFCNWVKDAVLTNIQKRGTNGLKNKGMQASTRWRFQRINNCIDTSVFCLPFKHHWVKRSINYFFDEWREKLFHPRKHATTQEVTAQPSVCQQLHQSNFKFLENLDTSKYLHIHTHLHACMPRPLCESWYLDLKQPSVSLSVGSVCLSLTHHTGYIQHARFSPRCSQCPSTKPPHWEDSALVTGGGDRRGGVTAEACECARFRHRLEK